jgi:RNA polymerase sigma factor (sigma-70 family)
MMQQANTSDGWAGRTGLLGGLLAEDGEAVRLFYDRYSGALRAIADAEMSAALRRRFDAGDVVQSALLTFLRGARDGRFQGADEEKLWSLICAITLNEVREQARFHLRERRTLEREVPLDDRTERHRHRAADRQLLPAEAAEFADEFRHFFNSLEDNQQRLLDMKLQRRSNAEIADALAISERTVERLLARLQQRLKQAFR